MRLANGGVETCQRGSSTPGSAAAATRCVDCGTELVTPGTTAATGERNICSGAAAAATAGFDGKPRMIVKPNREPDRQPISAGRRTQTTPFSVNILCRKKEDVLPEMLKCVWMDVVCIFNV